MFGLILMVVERLILHHVYYDAPNTVTYLFSIPHTTGTAGYIYIPIGIWAARVRGGTGQQGERCTEFLHQGNNASLTVVFGGKVQSRHSHLTPVQHQLSSREAQNQQICDIYIYSYPYYI